MIGFGLSTIKKQQKKPELIIAVGGGSVLDIAKSLAAILDKEYKTVEDLRTAITQKNTGKPHCPWIGIPTTAGTGSEVTCWATAWDAPKSSKLSLEDKRNYAYGRSRRSGIYDIQQYSEL